MSDETPKLLPCPLDGGEADWIRNAESDDGPWGIKCSKCVLQAKWFNTQEGAAACWNRHAAPAAPQVGDPKTWTLVLNEYQRNNLLLLLHACGYPYGNPHVVDGLPHFDTGDWLGEVAIMLGTTLEPGAQTNTTAQRWRDEIRAAAAAAAPQVVDRDGVLDAGCDMAAGPCSCGAWHDPGNPTWRALKAPPPPAAAPSTSRELTCEDVGCPKCCPPTPSAPPAAAPRDGRQRCGHEGPCDHCDCVMWRDEGETHCPVCHEPHPPTPSAPPPTGERTAGEAEADMVAWLRRGEAACKRMASETMSSSMAGTWMAQAKAHGMDAEAIERGEYIGSSASPAGTGGNSCSE